MRNCIGKILTVTIAVMTSLSSYAVIASPETFTITQPNGEVLKVKLVGDEFHSYYTLLDGTPIRRNRQGKWVKDTSITQESTAARKARRIAQQRNLSSTFPLTGSPKSIVILVNFSDLKFQYKLEDFQRMINESGYHDNGNTGSVRDYFIASSDSIFQPQFDCYGPVTLSKEYAYYGANSGDNHNVHASDMIVEACNLVAQSGVDFAQYDTNNDGTIDNVFVYYAGHNEAEGGSENTVWPHRSQVTTGERVGGKIISDYACTSELRGQLGTSMCGIGTFCHEFGHVLGLPDYYDTSKKNSYTIGSWDIMCSGNYNGTGKTPPSHTAGERFQLGWLKPIQLKEAGPYTLEPIETSNKAYLIAASDHNLSWSSASPNEYWLLENRQALGWDAPSTTLEGTGMLIWHVHYNAANWAANRPNNSQPLGYDIEEANGSKGKSTPSDPFPGSAGKTSFTPMLHDGTLLDKPIIDITQVGQDITFTFKSAGEDNFIIVPTELPTIESTYNPDNKKSYTPASKLRIAGNHLDPQSPVIASISGIGFNISTDSLNWQTNISINDIQSDSTLDLTLYVRYAPKKQICDIQRGTLTLRQNSAIGTYVVHGISPRPTLIEAPQISKIYEVTPTSFKINWAPQTDAEEYYVTLYHMEDGVSSSIESFEGFDDETTVQEAGWTSSFFRTTSKAKAEGSVSMWFKQEGENLTSPLYHLPVTEVSMWLSAPATSEVEVGLIILTGLTENESIALDTIEIRKSTKQYTYKKSLSESLKIRRFKIEYVSLGGEGVCLDAFTTTFNKKTVYTYKGREHTIEAQEGDIAEDYAVFYGYDLLPNTDYYIRLQCSENKGCQEHVSDLSQPLLIRTKEGEGVSSKHLTLAYDSISYDPGKHVIYIPQSLGAGSIYIYTVEGQLVKSIPVGATMNIVALPIDELRRGTVYSVKYVTNDKLSRKSPWIKILFQ